MRFLGICFFLTLTANAEPIRLGIVGVPKEKAAREVAAYIAKTTKQELQIVWAASQTELLDQAPEMAWLLPFAALEAKESDGAKIWQKAVIKGRSNFYSAILVRNDSDVTRTGELEGKDIGWTSATSASGYILPKTAFLKAKKTDANFFGKEVFLGDANAVLTALEKKIVVAGAIPVDDEKGLGTWNKAHPKLHPAFITPAYPGSALVSLNQHKEAEKIASALARFKGPAFKELFGVDGLTTALDKDYESLRFARSTLEAL